MPDDPNVLLLHTDQQRFDALGAHGNDEIHPPNLDRLAAEGVSLTRTYVNAPVCMPSRESYLTGKYPSELRIFDNGVNLPEGVPTLPEYFGRRGYATANVGKLHFRRHSDRDHSHLHPSYGFDHLELSDEPGCYEDAYRAWVRREAPEQLPHLSPGIPDAAEAYERFADLDRDIDHPEPRFRTEPQAFEGDPGYTHTAFVARRTMNYLREHAGERFLCVAGFYAPHQPWIAPREYLDLYDRADLSPPNYSPEYERRREEYSYEPEDPWWERVEFSDAELRAVKHGYYAMVSEVDHWVGEILDTLETLGELEDTLVVFTSDHGEDLGEHLRYGKGFPAWEGVARVPMLVHWPAGVENPGRREDGITELVDLVPTLLDAAGLQVPSHLQGQSFADALTDDGYEGRDVALLESHEGKAIRTDRYRYALTPDGEELLFDLAEDPLEQHDRSGDPDYEAERSRLRLAYARRTTEVSVGGERPDKWGA